MNKNTQSIFHSDFKVKPFWWDAYQPGSYPVKAIPKDTPVAILGGGYTGLAAALELHKLGIDSCVFEANEPGIGASTRSGGLITACGGIKTPLLHSQYLPEHYSQLVAAATAGLNLVENIIKEEGIECEWHHTGLFKAACTKAHFSAMHKKVAQLNQYENVDAELVTPERQRHNIGSDYYHGGLLTAQAAHLHPALYFEGLLRACEKRRITVCAHTEITELESDKFGWLVRSKQGITKAQNVIVATNGYTGSVTPALKRRVLPLKPYIIATEPITDSLARDLSPNNRSFVESSRIAAFFRLSGEKNNQRMIFGSRVKWRDIEADEMAPFLYNIMLQRLPQLEGVKITHAWTGNVALTLDEQHHTGKLNNLYYALGCNGSGVANMTYLGTQAARKVAGSPDYDATFDRGRFPDSRFYTGHQRWFIPLIGQYFQLRDWLDRKLDKII